MFNLPFQCKRSILISKSISEVIPVVGNFESWKHWSPWFCMEKDCHLAIEGNAQEPGHRQDWDGKRIGSGNMTMTSKADTSVHYDLAFLKPWKSKSTVEFAFEELVGEGQGGEERAEATQVTWIMNGSLPVFMFFMKKMMTAWVESDFDRGLLMLKDYLEEGHVEADTEVKGIQQKQGFYYLGIRKDSSIKEMPDLMSKDFEQLMEWVAASELPDAEQVLSFYHKFDMVNQRCEFTTALAYSKQPENSKNLVSGRVPDHQTLQVVHTGPYKHLGNAWGTVMSEQRAKKLKANKTIPWYELYLNSPIDVAEKDLKTEVNISIKT